MISTRRIVGALLVLAAVVALAALSRVPYDATDGDHALIRLSWRTPGELVNECRRLSAEELERLPVHMRREEVCEGRIVPYHLVVRLNGELVVDEIVRAAGAREDRPLYVYRVLEVEPGAHRLEVSWESERDDAAVDPHLDGGSYRVPPRLALDADLLLRTGDVSLITYDLDRREFVARGHGVAAVATN
jgi:hypothetical protein